MRNFHNLSFNHKLSTDMGLLVPIATMEVLPGDTFIHRTSLLARVAPLVNPVMHDVDISVHHWYVPSRLLWEHFEEWIVAKSTVEKPKITIDTTADRWDLLDHMGVPPATGEEIDGMPVRAYNMIWNEFYRDQDLQGPRDLHATNLARVCWDKDYYTTARPYPQQGEAVEIGFSAGKAPVVADVYSMLSGNVARSPSVAPANYASIETLPSGEQTSPLVYADLASMQGGIDINDLRRAIALQRFAEARMKFGSRYIDYLRYLGINPSDGRLDRPEYLGGGKQRINFSEVLAMAEGQTSNVGDMYGHGIAGLRARRYRKMFEEHGWMLTLLSVRPKTVYMDTFPRKFRRFDPMDVWQRELEVLPWQELKQQEIHYQGDPEQTFGYVPRYDEYRHEESFVSGAFAWGPEIDWHMARTFTTPPTLNSSFVECTPTDRIYGDKNMPELLINCQHSITAKRLVRLNAIIGGL